MPRRTNHSQSTLESTAKVDPSDPSRTLGPSYRAAAQRINATAATGPMMKSYADTATSTRFPNYGSLGRKTSTFRVRGTQSV